MITLYYLQYPHLNRRTRTSTVCNGKDSQVTCIHLYLEKESLDVKFVVERTLYRREWNGRCYHTHERPKKCSTGTTTIFFQIATILPSQRPGDYYCACGKQLISDKSTANILCSPYEDGVSADLSLESAVQTQRWVFIVRLCKLISTRGKSFGMTCRRTSRNPCIAMGRLQS